jgi:hypothetical protein
VIDVTNFSPKTDYRGSRENLHLVERWTRTGPTGLEYVVTIEDPTVWTRPWAVKQEFTKQSERENKTFYEPRCIEGNYGLPGLLLGQRVEEVAFAHGRGPDPAIKDNVGSLVDTAPIPPGSGSVSVIDTLGARPSAIDGRASVAHRATSLAGLRGIDDAASNSFARSDWQGAKQICPCRTDIRASGPV